MYPVAWKPVDVDGETDIDCSTGGRKEGRSRV